MQRVWIVTLVLCSWVAAGSATAAAEGESVAVEDLDGMDIVPSPTLHGQLRLTLADAVAMGIENNLDLQVERFDPLISFEDSEIAWGPYDPVGSGSLGYTTGLDPTSNALQGGGEGIFGSDIDRSSQRSATGTIGVESLMPWLGATVGLEWEGSRTTTNSPIASFSPEYDSSATVTARLPLLKGLIWNEPWTRVKTSEVDYRGSREQFRTTLMDTVRLIENAYWTVVANAEGVRVAQKSVETAQALLDQTNTQYEVGVVSKVEVVEAKAGLAQREFELIRADNLYWNSQDDLIDAVMGTRLTPESRIEIVPGDNPEDYVRYEIDVGTATDEAFRNRPELQRAQLAIDRNELNLRFAKNQRLPQFDLEGSYSVSGRRGVGPGRDNPNFQPDPNQPNFDPREEVRNVNGHSVNKTFKDYFTDKGGVNYSVAGVVSIPLGNIRGRHTVSRTQLELRKSKTELVRLRQDIVLQVREEARDLKSAQEGIDAAERRREAAAEQLRAEQIRLEYGESTPFNVLQREEDLFEAENEKIRALQLYRTSVVDLHRAQGTILKTRNIVVDEAERLR